MGEYHAYNYPATLGMYGFICQIVYTFYASDKELGGGISMKMGVSDEEKQKLAEESVKYNQTHYPEVMKLFEEERTRVFKDPLTKVDILEDNSSNEETDSSTIKSSKNKKPSKNKKTPETPETSNDSSEEDKPIKSKKSTKNTKNKKSHDTESEEIKSKKSTKTLETPEISDDSSEEVKPIKSKKLLQTKTTKKEIVSDTESDDCTSEEIKSKNPKLKIKPIIKSKKR